MPVTFDKIASGTATVSFTFKGDVITVVYYPNRLTKKLYAQMLDTNDEDQLLATLIKSWDIYEDAEMTVMFPVERVDDFGVFFKEQLMRAIGGDMSPEARAPQN